jgi:hypothetical protein
MKKYWGENSLYSRGEKISYIRASSAFVCTKELGNQFKNSSYIL